MYKLKAQKGFIRTVTWVRKIQTFLLPLSQFLNVVYCCSYIRNIFYKIQEHWEYFRFTQSISKDNFSNYEYLSQSKVVQGPI